MELCSSQALRSLSSASNLINRESWMCCLSKVIFGCPLKEGFFLGQTVMLSTFVPNPQWQWGNWSDPKHLSLFHLLIEVFWFKLMHLQFFHMDPPPGCFSTRDVVNYQLKILCIISLFSLFYAVVENPPSSKSSTPFTHFSCYLKYQRV